jgi:hypothetical protein
VSVDSGRARAEQSGDGRRRRHARTVIPPPFRPGAGSRARGLPGAEPHPGVVHEGDRVPLAAGRWSRSASSIRGYASLERRSCSLPRRARSMRACTWAGSPCLIPTCATPTTRCGARGGSRCDDRLAPTCGCSGLGGRCSAPTYRSRTTSRSVPAGRRARGNHSQPGRNRRHEGRHGLNRDAQSYLVAVSAITEIDSPHLRGGGRLTGEPARSSISGSAPA